MIQLLVRGSLSNYLHTVADNKLFPIPICFTYKSIKKSLIHQVFVIMA